jgi:predicted ATPase
MRHAEHLDWRRRAFEKNYPITMTRAVITGAPALGASVVLELRPPLTVVCGLNGSGKTRLLRVLAELTAPGAVPDSAIVRQIGAATSELTIRRAGGTTTQPRPSAEEPPVKVLWFDPVLLTAEIVRQFRDLGDLTDVLEGVEARPFDADLLAFARSIIQRDYSAIESFDLAEDDLDHPYFRVRWGEAEYGAEDMALGELSVLYFLHLLSRADASTMVFVEEPESFLSPVGQVALMDCIHYYCASKAHTFLVSTHSPAIAAQVPSNHLSCVERTGPGIVAVRSPPRQEALATIAIRERVGGIVFVEDYVASVFLREILRRGCSSYQHLIEVVVSGGKEKVLRALRSLLPIRARVPSVGVLDGDARNDPVEEGPAVLYLPGDVSPDRLLRVAAGAATERLSQILNVPRATIDSALVRAGGADDHDWAARVGEGVGLEAARVIPALIDVWLEVPANAAIAKLLFDDICAEIPGL